MPSAKKNAAAYRLAREAYASYGVDSDAAIKHALEIPISLHCWQADDVRGLETPQDNVDDGGIMATGSYPGRARNGGEIRDDLGLVLKLLPGRHRLNLHASYAETGGKAVDRDGLEPEHFAGWLAWAKSRRIGIDFNPTYFAHPLAVSGATLSHSDPAIRRFWISHARACRAIAQHFARALRTPCVVNHWVPDGSKDVPADRWSPRKRLTDSYDAILADRSVDRDLCIDAVEGKLFGLGSEGYVVGSQEFYLAYAQSRGLVPCLDLGHYHPTESVADKVSAIMQVHPRILLHTSRPVRWDSDHVVVFDDPLRELFLEIARGRAWDRVFVALDFFDASINRIAAYVIGTRATRQAILYGLLDPYARILAAERAGLNHERLALMEQAKALPWGTVWDELCTRASVPTGSDWLADVARHEKAVLSRRG
jgi:L-rhamnose isomerase